MNVLLRITTEYLKKQRKRTILTIVGVLLACALVSAIGIFLTSVQNMMLQDTLHSVGSHEFTIGDRQAGYLTGEQADRLAANHLVTASGRIVANEYAAVTVGQDEKGQAATVQLPLAQRDSVAMGMKQYTLLQGRLPASPEEIAVGKSVMAYLPEDLALGSALTLSVERDAPDPRPAERAFTVVGVYEGDSLLSQPLPGDEQDYCLLVQVAGADKYASVRRIMADNADIVTDWSPNGSYLRATSGGGGATQTALTATFILLAIIILTAMVMVIRNAFAMSASEKMAQFGILRCVGASPRQIRSMVRMEAMVIYLIAMPLGLALGVGAMAVVFAIVQKIDLMMLRYLELVVSPLPFLLAAGLSLAAVLLSARSPAKKAAAIAPIAAVKGNTIFQDVEKPSRRRGRLMRLFFGYPGVLAGRNIHRNRKRYLATVMSITISVTLFVSLVGFAMSMTTAFASYGSLQDADLVARAMGEGDGSAELDSLYGELSAEPGVAQLARVMMIGANLNVPEEHLADDWQTQSEKLDWMLNGRDTDSARLTDYEGDSPLLSGRQVWQDPNALVLRMDRALYEQLDLGPDAPDYDQLAGAVLCQRVEVATDRGLMSGQVLDYAVGDTVVFDSWLYQIDPELIQTQPQMRDYSFQVPVAALAEIRPWFLSKGVNTLLLVPERLEGQLLALPENTCTGANLERVIQRQQARQDPMPPDSTLFTGENPAVYVKALEGMQESLGERAAALVDRMNVKLAAQSADSSQGPSSIYLYDKYADYKESRNAVVVVNIFVYGFMAVVVLICSVNVVNTVTTNLQLRRREIAMLRATGMSRGQIWRMFSAECLLYAVTGAVVGGLLGLGLEALLLRLIQGAFSASMALSPWLLIGLGALASFLLAYLAGLSPLRSLLKRPIVEQIVAQE